MPAASPITAWHWAGFIAAVLILLALDLGVFHRGSRVVTSRESLRWTFFWFGLSMVFACILKAWLGPQDCAEFVTGYFVEYSLSLDNVVAIAVIFASFGVPPENQYRVLFWGVIGALVFRGIMIALGVTLVHEFHWMLLLMGLFLIFTGVKWIFTRQAIVTPQKNPVFRIARKFLPFSDQLDGQNFTTVVNNRRILTPLALVFLMVETADLLFAFDSVPAVFAVTQNAFIIFTSNILAVLGLRSLYFAAARAIQSFRHLKTGLAVILIFVGLKMTAERWISVPTLASLAVIAGILGVSIAFSLRSSGGNETA